MFFALRCCASTYPSILRRVAPGGCGRVLTAALLGLEDVPMIRLCHLDEAERWAYRIADNKLIELGDWDEAMLRGQVEGSGYELRP
jgi:hypothetical protein